MLLTKQIDEDRLCRPYKSFDLFLSFVPLIYLYICHAVVVIVIVVVEGTKDVEFIALARKKERTNST
jgi:hypothetical protein